MARTVAEPIGKCRRYASHEHFDGKEDLRPLCREAPDVVIGRHIVVETP
jgi:hypothetical protein